MKVILTQPVPGLGEPGTIKEVADGYARNFLLPRNMAVAATRSAVKQAESQANVYAKRANKAREQVQGQASNVEGKTVIIRARVGSENRLYGSVTANDVADAMMAQHGIELDRRKIEMGETIHRTGTYTATTDFGSGITAGFNVEVAPEAAGAHGKATKASGDTASPTMQATDDAPASDDAALATDDALTSDEAAAPIADDTASEEQAEEEVEANPS
ncbi:MAG: 50S ribosomal protein L9 [Chloroflexia bacterium]